MNCRLSSGMFDWLAVGWNLAMTVSGAFLVSLSFRRWPLRFDRMQALGHTLMTVVTVLLLGAYPHPLLVHTPPLLQWTDTFSDLRYVPLVISGALIVLFSIEHIVALLKGAEVDFVGRISWSTARPPARATCHAASQPAKPPPIIWMGRVTGYRIHSVA